MLVAWKQINHLNYCVLWSTEVLQRGDKPVCAREIVILYPNKVQFIFWSIKYLGLKNVEKWVLHTLSTLCLFLFEIVTEDLQQIQLNNPSNNSPNS